MTDAHIGTAGNVALHCPHSNTKAACACTILQETTAATQTCASPHEATRGGKPSAQIEQEVQRIVQSVLGAAVASDLPLMQARMSCSFSCYNHF